MTLRRFHYFLYIFFLPQGQVSPSAHQDHCGRCRIQTWDLCPRSDVRYTNEPPNLFFDHPCIFRSACEADWIEKVQHQMEDSTALGRSITILGALTTFLLRKGLFKFPLQFFIFKIKCLVIMFSILQLHNYWLLSK